MYKLILNTIIYVFGILTFAFSNICLAQSTQKIKFNGNEIELISNPSDTIYIENIETGEREMKISMPDLFPISMNGKTITNETHVTPLPERSLNEYFIDFVLQNKALFDQLSDGQYYLNPRHFVVNEEGKIMYYKCESIESKRSKSSPDIMTRNDVVKSNINKLINDYINSGKIRFVPAEKDGKKVLAIANSAYVGITVKDHKANVDLWFILLKTLNFI